MNELAYIILNNPSLNDYASLSVKSKNKYFTDLDTDKGTVVFSTQAEADRLTTKVSTQFTLPNGTETTGGSKETCKLFAQIAEAVKKSNQNSNKLEESGKTTADGQNTYWGTGVIDFSTLIKKLKTKNASGNDYLLQIARGFNRVEGDDPWFSDSAQSKFISKVVRGDNDNIAEEDACFQYSNPIG